MKQLSILTSLLVGAFLFAACDADRDDRHLHFQCRDE
jgi:hypothetical protein